MSNEKMCASGAKQKLKKASYWLSIISIGIVLGISLQFVRAWVEPAQLPPGGNIGAPINTGTNSQTKYGVFTVDTTANIGPGIISRATIAYAGTGIGGPAFYATAGSYTGLSMSSETPPTIGIADTGVKSYHLGNVGIGTTTPSSGTGGQLKLDVEGNIGAAAYCDQNGNNCKTAASLGGSSTFGSYRIYELNSGSCYTTQQVDSDLHSICVIGSTSYGTNEWVSVLPIDGTDSNNKRRYKLHGNICTSGPIKMVCYD